MRVSILKQDSEKRELVSRLSREKCSLMFFYEEPAGDDVPHEKVSESITVVYPPYDYDSLEKWLYLGNWQAIYPINSNYRPFDTFKAKNEDIQRQIDGSHLKIIIDSFHDDIEWNVIEEP